MININLGPGQRRIIKLAGYPLLFFVVFVFAAQYTFPYERVKDKISDTLSEKYDVEIAGARPGWLPGHMVLTGIKLSTRPEREEDKPTTLEIQEADISIGFLAALGGRMSIDFDAQVGAGRMSGHVSRGGNGALSVSLHTKGLPLETVPGVASIAGGAPIKGALDANVKIELPKGKWRDAKGSISLACSACVMGDGVTQMRPTAAKARNAFSEGGFTLPPTRLGTVKGKIRITKGVMCIDQLESTSVDGELAIEGGIKLDDPFARSTAQLYARFKISEDYKKKNDKMAAVVAGVPPSARRSDGYFGYYTREPVNGLFWKPAASNPAVMRECGGGSSAEPRADRGTRKPKDRVGRPTTGGVAPGADVKPITGPEMGGGALDRNGPPIVNLSPEGGRGNTPAPADAAPQLEVPAPRGAPTRDDVRQAHDEEQQEEEQRPPPPPEIEPVEQHDTDPDQPKPDEQQQQQPQNEE